MNTTQRWTIAIIAAVAIGVALFAGGIALGRTSGNAIGFGPGNMMTGYAPNQNGLPYGMMGYGQDYTGTVPYGLGMMGGYGMMGPGGMMGGNNTRLYGVKPLTVDQA